MVQKIHPRAVIWDPNSAPYLERFQFLKLLSECSILEPSLDYAVLDFIHDCITTLQGKKNHTTAINNNKINIIHC